ncbi:MAG: glycosyltransferase [Candidatus Aminicenantes bacterium]|nr:glycosyltransferase [Candidatus Aminicenantes bacterium]
MLATLAVIIGFFVRAARLTANREFHAQQRPENIADFPFVTIVVPARNEERNITFCLESLLALDYPRFEIFVVDDHSTDRTAEIVREIIEHRTSRPAVRLFLLGDDPNEGGVEWVCRKSHALWHGSQRAQGEWILFVDADTRQKSDTLWRAISLARRHDLQALSISGMFVNTGLWGGVLEAVITPAIFLVIPWHRVNNPDDSAAWMNGNFILYERTAYLSVGGHCAIAEFIQDDLALALHSKEMRVRFLFLPVSSAYECRDYVGLKEAFHGWTRRLAAGGSRLNLDRRSYFFGTGALFVVAVLPVLAAVAGLLGPLANYRIFGISFSAWALVQLGMVILFQGVVRAVMRMSVWPAVFAPLGAILGIGVVVGGYRARYVKRIIELRGRALAVNDDIS